MIRRRLTLKRIDPWSVLKFGFVGNLALLAITLLGVAVVWFFVQRLGLIEQVCTMAQELGFENCGVNGGNLFRAVLLLGLLGVIVQTGIWVFLAFLYNLIADLVGGLSFSFVDHAGEPASGSMMQPHGTATGAERQLAGTPTPGRKVTADARPADTKVATATGDAPTKGDDTKVADGSATGDADTSRSSAASGADGGSKVADGSATGDADTSRSSEASGSSSTGGTKPADATATDRADSSAGTPPHVKTPQQESKPPGNEEGGNGRSPSQVGRPGEQRVMEGGRQSGTTATDGEVSSGSPVRNRPRAE